jgi:hypothetical protein
MRSSMIDVQLWSKAVRQPSPKNVNRTAEWKKGSPLRLCEYKGSAFARSIPVISSFKPFPNRDGSSRDRYRGSSRGCSHPMRELVKRWLLATSTNSKMLLRPAQCSFPLIICFYFPFKTKYCAAKRKGNW